MKANKQKIQDLLSKFVGDVFVRNTLAEGFGLLPDSTIKEGDSWIRKSTQTADVQLEVTTKYTLKSIEDGNIKIEAESEVKSSGNTKSKVMGMEVLSNLSGTQTGEFKVDEITGILLSSKSETSVKGTIQVLGREIPIKIKMKKEITEKKIN